MHRTQRRRSEAHMRANWVPADCVDQISDNCLYLKLPNAEAGDLQQSRRDLPAATRKPKTPHGFLDLVCEAGV